MSSSPRRPGIIRAMVLALTIVASALALVVGQAAAEPPPPPIEGQPSPQDFVADATVTVVDLEATATAKQLARNQVETVYVQDEDATRAVLADVQRFFARAEEATAPLEPEVAPSEPIEEPSAEQIPDDEVSGFEEGVPTSAPPTTVPPPADLETQTERLSGEYGGLVSDATIAAVLEVLNGDFLRVVAGGSPVFDDIRAEANDLARRTLEVGDGIESGELTRVRADLLAAPPRLFVPGLDEEEREAVEAAVADVVASFLQVNRRIDEEATEAARNEAEANEPDVVETFVIGQKIVDEGEIVTPVQLSAILELDLIEPGEQPRLEALAAGGALVVILAVLILWRVAGNHWAQPKLVALFGLLLVLAALMSRIPEFIGNEQPELSYLIPAASFGYLAAILFDPRTAVLMAFPVGAFTALATGSVQLAAFATGAAVVSIPLVSAASSRTRLRLAVLYTGALMAPWGAAVAWFFEGPDLGVPAAGASAAGGVIAGVVALGLLPFFENTFRITTTLTLLDLADRNHPALRLIEEQAPGSFNHSILVGTLAGKAARSIGANPLLAQAAAYYHDLGKTARPQFFIENQFGVSNPHDEMTPEQSADIIREHVTEGLKLARRYRLPAEVVEGIRMHHGTGIMRFFYHKALAQDPGADPDLFRHQGERPRRKEMAILMLADACEGAVRSLVQHEDPSVDNIQKTVDQVVAEKLEDGQLDESSLTFGELTRVKRALVQALVGYYHSRIPYPGFPGREVAI